MDRMSPIVEREVSPESELSWDEQFDRLEATTDFADFVILANQMAHDGKPAGAQGGRCDVWISLPEYLDNQSGHVISEKVRLGVLSDCAEAQYHRGSRLLGAEPGTIAPALVAYENIIIKCRLQPEPHRFSWEGNRKRLGSTTHETPKPFDETFTASIDEDTEALMRQKLLDAFMEAKRHHNARAPRRVGRLGLVAPRKPV